MAVSIPLASSSGNFLVSPELGLMIWTLIAFGATLFVLSRFALPRIGEALEKRANAIRDSIDAAEKREGISRVVSGADSELVNFLELLAEKHRMPVIFRIRRRFDEMWAKEERRLEVRLTSAVELPSHLVERVGNEIEEQTGQTIELESDVDEEILGGIVLRVGNMVLDASVRNKLERLRKEVAKA